MKLEFKVSRNDFPAAPGKARNGVRKGFEAAKGPLLEDMRRRTRVDTGALRASETAEVEGESLVLSAGKGLPDARALFTHQGTRFMAPTPYMRDAIEQGAGRIADAIAAGIRGELG